MSVKINEFEQFANQTTTIGFNGLEINAKKYISEVQKLNIANQIANIMYMELDNEIEFSNKDLKNFIFVSLIIGSYTDIEIDPSKYVETSEIAVTSGLYDFLIGYIPNSEIQTIKDIIDFTIAEKRHNALIAKLDDVKAESVEVQLSNFLKAALDKIPDKKGMRDLLKSVTKQVEKFDINKLGQVNTILGEFGEQGIPMPNDIKKNIELVTDIVDKIDT